jgi:hypothetical protein
LFINDSFVNNRAQNLDLLNECLISKAVSQGTACGVVNYRNRIRGFWGYLALDLDRYGLKEIEFSAWLRSNFFLVPWRAVPANGFEVVKKEELFPDHLTPEIFRTSAPLSASLKKRIVDYLVPSAVQDSSDVWHSHFKLDETSYQFFAGKGTAIANEMYLGLQLAGGGIPVADIRLMSWGMLNRTYRSMDQQAVILYWTRAFRKES